MTETAEIPYIKYYFIIYFCLGHFTNLQCLRYVLYSKCTFLYPITSICKNYLVSVLVTLELFKGADPLW